MRIVIALLASISLCRAWQWNGAASTTAYTLVATGVSPVPTMAPFMQERELPGNYICGYQDGESNIPMTCPPSSSCAWHTDWNVVGCCHTSDIGDCFFVTGCVDAVHTNTRKSSDELLYTCPGTSTCVGFFYPDFYSQIGCADYGFTGALVSLTYSGQKDDAPTVQQNFIGTAEMKNDKKTSTRTRTSTASVTEISASVTETYSTSSGTSSSSSSAAATTSTSSASSSTSSSASNTTEATPARSGTSKKTIIGASVGSVAFGLILAAAVAWLLIRRKKKNSFEATPQKHRLSQEPMSLFQNPASHHSEVPPQYRPPHHSEPQLPYIPPSQSFSNDPSNLPQRVKSPATVSTVSYSSVPPANSPTPTNISWGQPMSPTSNHNSWVGPPMSPNQNGWVSPNQTGMNQAVPPNPNSWVAPNPDRQSYQAYHPPSPMPPQGPLEMDATSSMNVQGNTQNASTGGAGAAEGVPFGFK